MNPDPANKRVTLIVAALSSFLTPFLGSSVNIALPAIGNEFSADAVTLSWVTTSSILAAATFLVPFGRLADIHGRKRIFTFGAVIYTASAIICALSASAAMLISARFAQGLGGAMIFCTGISILASVFPDRERGRALGITVAAVYLGLSLGPPLGGFLTENFGWRSVFISNVPVGIALIILTIWKLKGEWAEARGEDFDFAGSILYSIALMTTIFGFSLLPERLGGWLLITGFVGFLAFVKWEVGATDPLLHIGLFRENRAFAFSNFAAMINYCSTFALFFLLSLYLQYITGLSPKNAGLVMIAQPLLMTVVSPMAGKLSDRIRPQILASMGMTFTALSLLTFVFLNEETSIKVILVSLMTLGLGAGLFVSPNANAVISAVENRFYGVASATLGTMRLTGNLLSMGIVMLVFTLSMGRIEIAPEQFPLLLEGIKTAFIIFAALSLVGVIASLAGNE